MGRLSFGDKDEEEYDNRLIARGKVMATLKSLEVLVILFIYLFIALFIYLLLYLFIYCFIFLLLFFIHFFFSFFSHFFFCPQPKLHEVLRDTYFQFSLRGGLETKISLIVLIDNKNKTRNRVNNLLLFKMVR